jgi:hypothetical protein
MTSKLEFLGLFLVLVLDFFSLFLSFSFVLSSESLFVFFEAFCSSFSLIFSSFFTSLFSSFGISLFSSIFTSLTTTSSFISLPHNTFSTENCLTFDSISFHFSQSLSSK